MAVKTVWTCPMGNGYILPTAISHFEGEGHISLTPALSRGEGVKSVRKYFPQYLPDKRSIKLIFKNGFWKSTFAGFTSGGF